MPKLIDYPRTSYSGAWEVAEVIDDTGGKCALETAARKLNRKVSGSFKAIVGSAVKFGLLTSKREMLTTTTLFRRIKHAYDKQEELLFHREAFLNPPLFSQLCRKFRARELPVAMLDVLLIREFNVEEINAQGVAKSFVDGARMVGLLDEHDTMADIDQLAAQQPPRRELASPAPGTNVFRQPASPTPRADARIEAETDTNRPTNEIIVPPASQLPDKAASRQPGLPQRTPSGLTLPANRPAPTSTTDAIASLFNLPSTTLTAVAPSGQTEAAAATGAAPTAPPPTAVLADTTVSGIAAGAVAPGLLFRLQLTGPGINTTLDVVDADDLTLVRALLDKIERQLNRR